jgi:hypothetical protein
MQRYMLKRKGTTCYLSSTKCAQELFTFLSHYMAFELFQGGISFLATPEITENTATGCL